MLDFQGGLQRVPLLTLFGVLKVLLCYICWAAVHDLFCSILKAALKDFLFYFSKGGLKDLLLCFKGGLKDPLFYLLRRPYEKLCYILKVGLR